MSLASPPLPPIAPPRAATSPRPRSSRRRVTSLFAHGESMIWLTGGSLAICLLMILGLLALVFGNGVGTFWPDRVVQVDLRDGTSWMGEVTETEDWVPGPEATAALPEASRQALAERGGRATRELLRTGNYELTGTHYRWVGDFEVTRRSAPEWALVVERMEWGRFYGILRAFRLDGQDVATTPEAAWAEFQKHHDAVRERWEERRRLETEDVGEVNRSVEEARLAVRKAEMAGGDVEGARRRQREVEAWAEGAPATETSPAREGEFGRLRERIRLLNAENDRYEVALVTSGGAEKVLKLADVVRAYPANQLSGSQRMGVYLSRWGEFLADEPREANSEGGVWPAIFGTVVMTLLMSLLVVPFGVLAALYLREYAKGGWLISTVRVAINNLAGVPSIVFGVFGLGFFCYIVGASLDDLLFAERLPNPTYGKGGLLWASLTLALLTLPVVIVATEEALAAVPRSMREGSFACGASKWQTIRRIVLPRAMPGIMTGMILAIARGAGEVAPLMLVGAVKLAPELPIDATAPFLHPERSFMHLGFHIYDQGFQSQNSEAAKPMVYTTTLLLVGLIVLLNVIAIWVRARLRRKFLVGGA